MASARTIRGVAWVAFAGVVLLVGSAGLLRLLGSHDAGTVPPVLGQVPAFTLTERSGRQVGSADLAGRPWVAGFIFTRCSSVCPAVTGAMASLQASLAGRAEGPVQLVSFSVDPGHDTAEVLRRYASGTGADADRWWFLGGDKGVLFRLIRDGFHLSVAELPPGQSAPADGELITHSDRLVLVDAEQRIRGYYSTRDGDAVTRLLADLARIDGR